MAPDTAAADVRIRILLAEAQPQARARLWASLHRASNLDVVAEAGELLEAVALAASIRPDVAIVAAPMVHPGGWDRLRAVREGGCRVLLLAEGRDLEILVAALEEGVEGVRTRGCPDADLVASIRAVHRGETVVPPALVGPLVRRLFGRRQERDDAFRRLARLTPRERQVLGLLTRGMSNRKIAEALVISPDTARTHVSNVLGKLDVHSRNDAAAFVARHGFEEDLVGTDA